MLKRRRAVVLGGFALLLLTLLLVVVLIAVQTLRPEGDGEEEAPLELTHALTPEEVGVEVEVRADGRLDLTQHLVFDTPDGDERPLSWSIGTTRVGWVDDDRSAQYVVEPVLTDVVAAAGSEEQPLAVQVDEPEGEWDRSSIRLEPSAPWAPGRHSVVIRYRVGGVWVSDGSRGLLVLPMQFVHGPGSAVAYRRVQLPDGATPACLADDTTFTPDPTCLEPGLTEVVGEAGGSGDALALLDPTGITVAPAPLTEKKR